MTDLLHFHKSVPVLKQHARHDKRNLLFANYTQLLPPAPEAYGLFAIPSTTPSYYGNNQYGDCTKAAYAGMVYSLSTAAGKPFDYTDAQVLQMYAECDGFNAKDIGTDNGSDGLTTLKYLQKSGAFGHAPLAYLALNLSSPEAAANEIRMGARYFGGLYIGVALPKAWQGETTWDVSPQGVTSGSWAPWSWGGHMIYGKARYTPDYLELLTWEQTYRITWKALALYPDEIYAVLIPDFKSPDGFDNAQLQTDLAAIQ